MRRPQFEVSIIIEGEPETSAELLKAAMDNLFKIARRIPPDHRFDWRSAHIETSAYVF